MRTRQSMGRRALAAFLLLLLLTAAAVQACAENNVGIARVYGYKDKIVNDDRKFAPYAVLRDEAHSSKYTLKYKYTKGDNYTRTWTLWMLNDKGEPVNHHIQSLCLKMFQGRSIRRRGRFLFPSS